MADSNQENRESLARALTNEPENNADAAKKLLALSRAMTRLLRRGLPQSLSDWPAKIAELDAQAASLAKLSADGYELRAQYFADRDARWAAERRAAPLDSGG